MIVKLRDTNHLPSHRERLLARGMLTQEQIAKQLGVSPKTIHAWRRAGLLTAHRANDRYDWLLTRHRPPATPGSSNAAAGGTHNEKQPHQPQEVHYETKPFA